PESVNSIAAAVPRGATMARRRPSRLSLELACMIAESPVESMKPTSLRSMTRPLAPSSMARWSSARNASTVAMSSSSSGAMIVGSSTRGSTVPSGCWIDADRQPSETDRTSLAPVRAVIADDELLLREGVARLLEEAGIEVVARAADAPDLLRKVRGHKPDVAIIDVRMPPDLTDDGLRAALAIREELPEVRILLLSRYVEDRYVGELLGGGAEGVGYLLKDRLADVDRLTDAGGRAAAGGAGPDPPGAGRE